MESYHIRAYLKQDYNNNFFDVIFHVEGRELFAHREILAQKSSVFKELFIKNRANGNELIQIDGYSYDEFYEFLRLIYFRNENRLIFTDQNYIFAVIKLAHEYKAYQIKEYAGEGLLCDGGFKAIEKSYELSDADFEDVFEKIAFAHKYSLIKFTKIYFVWEITDDDISYLIEYNGFINLEKTAVIAFVHYVLSYSNFYHKKESNVRHEEELCKAVYKWGKHQAMITVEMSEKEKNKLILHYIKDILPIFKYKKMSIKFLFEFAVPNGLISIDEANEYATIKVNITSNDKSITGSFVDRYGIFEVIKYHENHEELDGRGSNQRCFWNEKFKRPSTPSTVEKMKGCEWYLAFDRNGKLNLKSKITKTDYLIAEMKSEENGPAFILDKKCNVFATVSRKK